ncbi:hypothetical protein BVRB_2g035710 [Beta vulgaris subsp. vulgaris]|nr:hypothetical protein BVRB_2g035710 [Beta vulgaris subsp. vulgaris]
MTIQSVIIQKLLSTNAHLGRRITAHHFKPFTYGTRNGASIIDSDKTLISLRNSLDFISHLVRAKSRFLFVNTNPLFDDIFDHMTRKIGHGSFLSPQAQYWRLGGFLTNSASPKKFRSRNKKICFAPAQPPDCVVILDFDKKSSVINEAARLGIPIIGLVDSSVPREVFQKITYPIPCNDSVQFVYMVCNLITKTFLLEQKNLSFGDASTADAENADNADVDTDLSGEAKLTDDNQSAEEMKVVSYSA